LEAILRVALEGPNETFDNVNDEAIVLWENGTGSIIMLILHVICLLQVTFFVQQLQLCFLIPRTSISFKVACIVVLSDL
jgi:hypothetical protein